MRVYGVRPERLKLGRRGHTQQWVADELGVSKSTVSAWERGTTPIPCDALDHLAELVQHTTDYFFGRARA